MVRVANVHSFVMSPSSSDFDAFSFSAYRKISELYLRYFSQITEIIRARGYRYGVHQGYTQHEMTFVATRTARKIFQSSIALFRASRTTFRRAGRSTKAITYSFSQPFLSYHPQRFITLSHQRPPTVRHESIPLPLVEPHRASVY